MRVLNLYNRDKSDIKYDIIKFSDSQILINLWNKYEEFGFEFSEKESIKICSRMSWGDLQYIIVAANALRKHGVKKIHLYVPYFLGARSDRAFQKKGVNYLKDVIAPIINSLNLESVTVLDPHSSGLENCINNFIGISNKDFVDIVLNQIESEFKIKKESLIWIIPDKGATDKAEAIIKELYSKTFPQTIQCLKKRNIETGKLEGYTIVGNPIFEGEPCIIVDDICDGGATFIQIATDLKKRGAGDLFLVTTHAILSKDVFPLIPFFKRYYCTNSFKDKDHVNSADLILRNFVKEINAFPE